MDEEVQAPLSLFACIYYSLISHQPDLNTFSRTLECTGNPIHPDYHPDFFFYQVNKFLLKSLWPLLETIKIIRVSQSSN